MASTRPDFDPSKITVPQDWLIRFLYKEEPVDAETRSSDNFTDAYQTLLEQLADQEDEGAERPDTSRTAARPVTRRARRVVFPAGA